MFFQDIKIGEKFNTKSASYEKIGYDKARVIKSALFKEGHEMHFELNFSVVAFREREKE